MDVCVTPKVLETPTSTDGQEPLAYWVLRPTEEQSICIIYCNNNFA